MLNFRKLCSPTYLLQIQCRILGNIYAHSKKQAQISVIVKNFECLINMYNSFVYFFNDLFYD